MISFPFCFSTLSQISPMTRYHSHNRSKQAQCVCVCVCVYNCFFPKSFMKLLHAWENRIPKTKRWKWLKSLIKSCKFWPGKASDFFFFFLNIPSDFPNEAEGHFQIFTSSPCLASPLLKFLWNFDSMQDWVFRLPCSSFWAWEHPIA